MSAAADQTVDNESGLRERIAELTARLHEALHQLGYDQAVERAADALPDARDRLDYIASLTGRAADRALGRVEATQPLLEELASDAQALHTRWAGLRADLPVGQQALLDETLAYLEGVPARTAVAQENLLDILMAQDFHDLTGQVIKRITTLATDIEVELIQMLRQTDDGSEIAAGGTDPAAMKPARGAPAPEAGGLAGPVIPGAGRTDVVTDQSQVDDLLSQLGF